MMVSEIHDKKQIARHFGTFIALLIIWQALSVAFRLPFIPSPMKVFENLTRIFLTAISQHLIYSLWRISAGIILSMVIGVPLGFCMGYWSFCDKLLSPLVYFLYPIPKIALLPIVMLLLGLGDMSKIVMIMMIVVFQVLVASRDSVKGIPTETYHSLYSLGASPIDIFKRIIIPATMPGLLTSIRVSLGTALSVLFFTETFGTTYGMGYFIMDAWMRVNYIEMYSGIVVLSVSGFILFTAVDWIEAIVCKWKSDK